MLRSLKGLKGCPLSLRRGYSVKSPILFVPNETIHRFESEKLTEEENLAAIPKRPNFDGLPKYHHEILSPEDTADLVIRPDVNDILTSTFSQNAVFTGDPNYKVTPANANLQETTLSLHFAVAVIEWIRLFNTQIVTLKSLPSTVNKLQHINEAKVDAIKAKLNSINVEELKSVEVLDKFYTSFEIYRKGDIMRKTRADTINIENISSILLTSELIQSDSELFDITLRYLGLKLTYFSNENLQQFTEKLINHLHGENITSGMKVQSFNNFMSKVFEIHPRLKTELHVSQLDKLAYLFTLANNIEDSKSLLQLLVTNYKVAPSKETFNLFLTKYTESLKNFQGLIKSKVLKDLHQLKPVFFHNGLDSFSLKFLLEEIIEHVYDLDHLMRLIENKENSSIFLLSEFAEMLMQRLQVIQSTSEDPNTTKALQLTQLISKLVKDNGVKLDKKSLELAQQMYKDLGDTSNYEYIGKLLN